MSRTSDVCVPFDRGYVLKGDRAAKRLRILLREEMQVLGLRSGQVTDFAMCGCGSASMLVH